MNHPSFSIIVPAYNEEQRLQGSLTRIGHYFQDRGTAFEVIVVDDGSTDGTFKLARQFSHGSPFPVQVLRNPGNRGKGYSVRQGILNSRGPLALVTDSDLSTPIEELPELEAKVNKDGCVIAFGSRDLASSRVEVHQSRYREYSGKLFNRIVRLLTGLPFHDTQCGFKLFKMKDCRKLFELQRIDGFAFDVEILYLARKSHLKMAEVPVRWRHAGGSKVRFASDAPRMLLDLVRILCYDWNGLYEFSKRTKTNRPGARAPGQPQLSKSGVDDDQARRQY